MGMIKRDPRWNQYVEHLAVDSDGTVRRFAHPAEAECQFCHSQGDVTGVANPKPAIDDGDRRLWAKGSQNPGPKPWA